MPDDPQTPPVTRQPLLPGMAMIAMYLMLIAMLNAFAALRGTFGAGAPRYSIFGVCSLMVIGVFGLLRMARWGWSIVTAGCLLMAAGYFYGFHRAHAAPYVVQGIFDMLFFLYLVRPEVRERLR
jgi:hypothetical protein